MARVVMYLEVPDEGTDENGSTAYDRVLDTLDELIETGALDGYFTLTFNGQPWCDRVDLKPMAQVLAEAQQKGGA